MNKLVFWLSLTSAIALVVLSVIGAVVSGANLDDNDRETVPFWRNVLLASLVLFVVSALLFGIAGASY